MKAFGKWIANSPEGTMLKVAAGAGLGALLDWMLTSEVNPIVVVITAAMVPVIVNYLNPQDARYGTGRQH